MSTKVAEIFETMAYGPAPEQSDYVQEWLDGHPDGFDLFIGGKWVAPEDKKKTIESRDPATGEPLARFSIAGKADVDKAVEAAQKALPNGRDFPAIKGRGIFMRWPA
ncbi:hypothetical protein JCM17844_02190 [Iodidimonas gelatinilytica]|uniref:Aldehyde dehydrogenase domain-containing protein n=1 Tax=Iodidimonas gelatinilytica TaxID=1236966 RepID=A0A5A7MKN5_9PROT|nr:aldehyde dehydrogenase family protein [Iodidimonas gelatinilytica]GEQ96582.1 hypothetical protein JCM17844_02190 [Iodidimonas gelatinilytica]